MEPDIDEPLEQSLQHAMAIAAQVGRELARAWRQKLEEASKLDTGQAEVLRQAFVSERDQAAVVLSAVGDPNWWDSADLNQIKDAYLLANTWSEADQRARVAEETIRLAAAERYGVDPDRLFAEGHRHTEHLMNTSPERLEQAQRWARRTGWESEIPSHYPQAQHLHNLLSDFDRAQEQSEQLAAAAHREDAEAQQLREQAGADLNHGRDELAAGEARERLAQEFSPADLASAREWGLANDPEYATLSEAERLARDEARVAELKGGGDPELGAQGRAQAQGGAQREAAGLQAAGEADVAYTRAESLQRQAVAMKANGAPVKAVEARLFGQTQQAFGPEHAAAGAGAKVGKVKGANAAKAKEQARQLTR